jgi:hypothetical protein
LYFALLYPASQDISNPAILKELFAFEQNLERRFFRLIVQSFKIEIV